MNRRFEYYVPAPDYESPHVPEEPDPFLPTPDYGANARNAYRSSTAGRPSLTRIPPGASGIGPGGGLHRSPPSTTTSGLPPHFPSGRPPGLHRSPPSTTNRLVGAHRENLHSGPSGVPGGVPGGPGIPSDLQQGFPFPQRSPPATAQGFPFPQRSPPATAQGFPFPQRSPPATGVFPQRSSSATSSPSSSQRRLQPSEPVRRPTFLQRSPPSTIVVTPSESAAAPQQSQQSQRSPTYEMVSTEQQTLLDGRIYEAPRAPSNDVSTFREENEYEYRLEKALPSPDQQRSPKGSIKDYIKAIGGVPVLPPLGGGLSPQKDVGKMEAVENLAFRHHVINHRKYDTLNSFKSCENCPICQSMMEGEVPISIRHRGRKGHMEESSIISGTIYEKLEEDALEALEDLDQYVNADSSATIPEEPEAMSEVEEAMPHLGAQAIRNFEGRNPDELSVKQGEMLEVLQQKNIWWKCRNSEGKTGWIPVQEIYVMSVE